MLRAADGQAGHLVKCPTCLNTMSVPQRTGEAVAQPVGAAAGDRPSRDYSLFTGTRTPGRRYGFNCVYCSSRLEANEAMAAQEGQCPTCGNQIVIPILDRYGRLIDPKTKEVIKQAPHPVHAYAAAGDRAPGIVRRDDGTQVIKCPRCGAVSPVTSNNCKACGMPFTMEGTIGGGGAGASNGFCVASMVLGIIGIPAGCTVIPSVLAVLFGAIGLAQIRGSADGDGGRGMAIGGIVCGIIGGVLALMYYLWK